MSSLRAFLVNDPAAISPVHRNLQLAIFNTNTNSVSNGGACCCWIVPAGTTYAVFEVWGGGGDGAGACCCMGHYYGPNTGAYGKKYLNVSPGDYFCICAGGSGCCSQPCCGTCGFASYALCGSNGTAVACGPGGCGGCNLCFRSYQGCTGICLPACQWGCGTGDFGFHSISGANHVSNYCWQIMKEWLTGSPKYAQNTRMGLDHCVSQLTTTGCCPNGGSKWPGGPGNSATACGGGCCWGGWGAGGLVLITYG